MEEHNATRCHADAITSLLHRHILDGTEISAARVKNAPSLFQNMKRSKVFSYFCSLKQRTGTSTLSPGVSLIYGLSCSCRGPRLNLMS